MPGDESHVRFTEHQGEDADANHAQHHQIVQTGDEKVALRPNHIVDSFSYFHSSIK